MALYKGLVSLGTSPMLHMKVETKRLLETMYINYINVRALINISHNQINKVLMLQLYFLHTISHNSDMFRSTLIIFRELLNLN